MTAGDIDVERVRAAVLERLTSPDPDTGELYETEWRIEVSVIPAEVDDETGEVDVPAHAVAMAYDLGHHSNVLVVTMNGYEVEEIG